MSEAPTAALAEFAAGLTGDALPAPVRAALALHVLDLAGGMAVGGALPDMALLIPPLAALRPADATVPGYGRHFSAPVAAGLVAAMSHAAEADAFHVPATVCVDAVAIPPVLAVAELHPVPGPRAVAAIAAGIEVAARIGVGLGGPQLLGRGWWPTALCGGAGAAAAAGVAMGLDAGRLRHAMSLALVQAGGAGVGAPEAPASRNLMFANVIRNAVEAALLARDGLTGPAEPLADARGLAQAFPVPSDLSAVTDGLGERWAATETSLKTFPCALQAQSALDALRTALVRANVGPEAVQAVTVALPEAMKRIVDRPGAPASHLGAAASIQFLCAALLADGDIALARLETPGRADPAILKLSQKVAVTHDPALDARFPAEWPARVTLRHADGEQIVEVAVPPGHPTRPLDRDGVVAKFRTLAGARLGRATGAIETLCLGVEELENAAAIPHALDIALTG